jgi:hypothetical protein
MLRLGIVRPMLDLEALGPLDYVLLCVELSVLSADHELERQKVLLNRLGLSRPRGAGGAEFDAPRRYHRPGRMHGENWAVG